MDFFAQKLDLNMLHRFFISNNVLHTVLYLKGTNHYQIFPDFTEDSSQIKCT